MNDDGHFDERVAATCDRDEAAMFFAEIVDPFRYVWPAEVELMAEIAGLRPRERWANGGRKPFTSESRAHIAVWERVG